MSSRGINKVILVGYLGQASELRYMLNGNAVANLSLATSESWKDKNSGEPKEHTEWHRVILFGKLAEIAKEYLLKGSQIYIEGQLRTRKWFDQQNNVDRYITEIIVGINGVMQMLGGKRQENSYSQPSPQTEAGKNTTQPVGQPSSLPQDPASFYADDPMDFDDIPF